MVPFAYSVSLFCWWDTSSSQTLQANGTVGTSSISLEVLFENDDPVGTIARIAAGMVAEQDNY